MVSEKKKQSQRIPAMLLGILLAAAAIWSHYRWEPWGFYRKVPAEEAALRTMVVQTAERYFGCSEADGSHRKIIDLYNSHTPLAMGYTVQYEDSWCSAFVSAVAIQCRLTEILPTECGCERHIGLFQALDRWEESDSAVPLPGDLIFYDWNMDNRGECTGWADHVGIVVGTKWPFIKVIEGNYDDQVRYRYLTVNHRSIRGFGKPDYSGLIKRSTP